MQAPNWSLPFELMCDASDFCVGAVLGQRVEGKAHVIAYASRTLDDGQENYTTTEKEILTVVFAVENFGPMWFVTRLWCILITLQSIT